MLQKELYILFCTLWPLKYFSSIYDDFMIVYLGPYAKKMLLFYSIYRC